jgi:hypothetical protein
VKTVRSVAGQTVRVRRCAEYGEQRGIISLSQMIGIIQIEFLRHPANLAAFLLIAGTPLNDGVAGEMTFELGSAIFAQQPPRDPITVLFDAYANGSSLRRAPVVGRLPVAFDTDPAPARWQCSLRGPGK